jgi:hypothetical protein
LNSNLFIFTITAEIKSRKDSLIVSDSTGLEGLSGFRRWWAQLWPAADPIGVNDVMEADDRKMHYGYTDHNGKSKFQKQNLKLCDIFFLFFFFTQKIHI